MLLQRPGSLATLVRGNKEERMESFNCKLESLALQSVIGLTGHLW